MVFFSVSTRSSCHLHLQVVFIFKLSSSSSLLRLQFFFIFKSPSSSSFLHLQVFFQVIFFFKSSSSRDLDHHCIKFGSSLSLDHHHIWIITWSRSSSSLDHHHHHRCYLSILLVIGSSTEPALFHAGCRPRLQVGILQHLYLTLS